MNIKYLMPGIIFMLGAISLELNAQNNNEDRTLFNSSNLENIGFMVAPSYGFTQMDGAAVSLANIRTGIILQDRFTFGGFYGFSLNDINPESETIPNIYMDFRSYGGFFEYTIRPFELLHFTFPLMIGGGEVEMDNEEGSAGLGEDSFFLLEPGALLEINLHKNIRFNIGATYRLVGDTDYRSMDQQDMSGFTGQIGLKFGIF